MPPFTTRTTSPNSSRVAPSGSRNGRRRNCRAFRAVVAGRDESGAHPLSLGDRLGDVDTRIAQGCCADPCRRTADARRRTAQLELGRSLRRGDRPADAKRSEAERLRERAQDDQVRLLGEQRHAGRARVLVVGLVDHDGGRRMRARAARRSRPGRAAPRSGCSGCRPRSGPRPSAESVGDAPASSRRDPVEPVRGLPRSPPSCRGRGRYARRAGSARRRRRRRRPVRP